MRKPWRGLMACARLADATRAEVAAQGVEDADVAVTARAHLRYDGTDTALPVVLGEAGAMRDAFEALHRQRFGFVSPEKGMIAALEVEAAGGEASDSCPAEPGLTPWHNDRWRKGSDPQGLTPTLPQAGRQSNSTQAALGMRRLSSCAPTWHPAIASLALRLSWSRTRPWWWSRAGAWRSRPATT
jgi:N-methylhydantoinase A/oxoprolinase/acetone carboxylase beta subunit